MRLAPSFGVVVLAVAAISLAASAKLSRRGEPSVTFTAVGPVGLKIHGESHDLTVDDAGSDLSVKVPLAGLKTGITLRDTHMREKYLEVEKYPVAELTVARSSLKLPSGNQPVSADGKGIMRIHGKEKPVSFHYDVRRNGSSLHVNGTAHVNMKDYGIDVPSYAGVTVKPDIEVAVEFDAADG
jgi:polyisoprenoid-binding protein YceI